MSTLENGLIQLQKNDQNVNALLSARFDTIVNLFNRYTCEIELFNKTHGLVKIKTKEEFIVKHILDSLAPLTEILKALDGIALPVIADAGSGAGLPGIPLAITMPKAKLKLIERMEKRADFLRNVQAVLQLNNAEVLQTEVERINENQFDLICFRAFKPLDSDEKNDKKFLTKLFSLLKPNGIIAAYKGRKEKILQELDAIGSLAYNAQIIPCPVPFLDEERHLLLIGKHR
ncbi:ribosomal RNA small subunit methyltransferase G [Spirochaetia bacterium]|nr:ribosomal RNA small subunit methyltransferase G [Spirochaetia bacterium]